MKRSPFFLALLVVLAQGNLFAQEAAAGGQALAADPTPAAGAPAPLTPTQPSGSGLLTPPPDGAAPAATPAPATTPATPAPAPAPAAPAPTETHTPMTRQEIAQLQDKEIIRRQELEFRANHAITDAKKAEMAQDYPEARKNYLFAAEAFGSISRSTATYATAAEGLTRVDFQLYDNSLKIGDTARAKMLMEEVVKYNPNNKLANDKLAAISKAVADPNDTTLLGNPAVTPGFVKKVNEVQQLFDEAEQFRRTGQWDEAEARLRRILGIDAHNIAATQQLNRIEDERNQYFDKSRMQRRDEMLREVEQKWYEPINNRDAATPDPQGPQPPIVRTTNFDLDQKMKSIFLSLDFNNATIEEATSFLSVESKRLDTQDHKGVNFIIQPEASTSAKPISLTLNNVPLGEALRYVCQLANVKFKVQDYAISIVPFSSPTEDLISRTFIVQPNFVVPPTAAGVIPSAVGTFGVRPIAPPANPGGGGAATPDQGGGEGDVVRQALEAKGLKFPPGASAVYTPTTGQLTVVDTADQMELLEELVNAGQAPTLMVRIATKFVEINQTDLNDLTFNAALNFLDPTTMLPLAGVVTNNPLTSSHFSTAMPGALAFAPDSIDQLISPQITNFNSFFFRSFLNGAQYNVVISALSQKKSFDLLSEPAVLTKSGEQGVLEAVRIFPYPIAFDPPELQTPVANNNNGGGGGGVVVVALAPPVVIATTPTDFKRRNVGVRLVVKPQVTADNKTIDLSLFPEVTDFEGFINYGSPIFVANPDNTESLLSTNEINQPVFNTRRINTKVLIRDNCTVVLGGLIRDDIQNVNDKVPILGDLPLVGRLFQSKAVTNTKRNLIIFVTANIYRNDGELLNPPEVANAAAVLTGRAGYTPPVTP